MSTLQKGPVLPSNAILNVFAGLNLSTTRSVDAHHNLPSAVGSHTACCTSYMILTKLPGHTGHVSSGVGFFSCGDIPRELKQSSDQAGRDESCLVADSNEACATDGISNTDRMLIN